MIPGRCSRQANTRAAELQTFAGPRSRRPVHEVQRASLRAPRAPRTAPREPCTSHARTRSRAQAATTVAISGAPARCATRSFTAFKITRSTSASRAGRGASIPAHQRDGFRDGTRFTNTTTAHARQKKRARCSYAPRGRSTAPSIQVKHRARQIEESRLEARRRWRRAHSQRTPPALARGSICSSGSRGGSSRGSPPRASRRASADRSCSGRDTRRPCWWWSRGSADPARARARCRTTRSP